MGSLAAWNSRATNLTFLFTLQPARVYRTKLVFLAELCSLDDPAGTVRS